MAATSAESQTLPLSALPRPARGQAQAFCYLSDNRKLAYEEYGLQSGPPLFYFHDSGSSRLEGGFFHAAARNRGIRLIAVDRPGIGCSDYAASHGPRDFSRDVLQLADYLGIKRFSVMALGAGGIYSLTLARYFPHRLNRQIILAGVPGSVFNESHSRSYLAGCWNGITPVLIKCLVRLKQRFFAEDPQANIERLRQYLSYSDRKLLKDAAIVRRLARDQQEALRFGHRGVAQDVAVCFRKLDFSLGEVSIPTFIWQGSSDQLSQRADCEFMQAHMPNARFYRVPDRGHFFFVHKCNRVLACLDEARSTGATPSLAA